MEAYRVTDHTDPLESLRHEILVGDIIKKTRPALELFAVEVRRFVGESMVRGFDRTACKDSIAVFLAEVLSLIQMAENSIRFSNSPKAQILGSDLQALKTSLGVFVRALEKSLLEKPDPRKQMLSKELRKIK